jgi:hypothetical protein
MARSRSSTSRPTIFDPLYGQPPSSDNLIRLWNSDLTNQLLDLMWKGYDRLYDNLLAHIPWGLNYRDLERSITEAYVSAIETVLEEVKDGYFPCKVMHSPFERASQFSPKAQPPAYDLAFVWNSDPRIMWPIEAKVLKTDKDTEDNLGDYVKTLNERYLTCKYAPFSNGAAMISYLKSGDVQVLFTSITTLSGYSLQDYPEFPLRHHKYSDHVRIPPDNKDYPQNFRCHHLVLILAKS